MPKTRGKKTRLRAEARELVADRKALEKIRATLAAKPPALKKKKKNVNMAASQALMDVTNQVSLVHLYQGGNAGKCG